MRAGPEWWASGECNPTQSGEISKCINFHRYAITTEAAVILGRIASGAQSAFIAWPLLAWPSGSEKSDMKWSVTAAIKRQLNVSMTIVLFSWRQVNSSWKHLTDVHLNFSLEIWKKCCWGARLTDKPRRCKTHPQSRLQSQTSAEYDKVLNARTE